MVYVEIHRDDIDLSAPTLVEGLPGVGPVGSFEVDTDALVGQAKERLARQMREADDKSTSARPLGFQ